MNFPYTALGDSSTEVKNGSVKHTTEAVHFFGLFLLGKRKFIQDGQFVERYTQSKFDIEEVVASSRKKGGIPKSDCHR